MARRAAARIARPGMKTPKAPSLALPLRKATRANDMSMLMIAPSTQCGMSLLGSLPSGAVASRQRAANVKPINVASIELRPSCVQ